VWSGDELTLTAGASRRHKLGIRVVATDAAGSMVEGGFRLTAGPPTPEAASADAGFSDFPWVDAVLDPTEHDDPHWRDFMELAPLTAFTASRA